jgi:transposase
MRSKNATRRRHGAEFKAKVLAACNEPGASIAAVALAHGLNANLVRKWRMGRGLKLAGIAARVVPSVASTSPLLAADARFLPIEMSTPSTATRAGAAGQADAGHRSAAIVHVELKRGASSLTVRWPSSAAGDCAAWLRELAAGLLK